MGQLPRGDGQELADNCKEYGAVAVPEEGESPDAYEPTLGGSAIPVAPDPDGTLYDQLIDGGEYYTQSLWSNGEANCELQTPAAPLDPGFTAPAAAATGATVDFEGSPSASEAGFSSSTWNFGDGSAPTFTLGAPSTVTHAFGGPGDYLVTLTVVDADGDLATSSRSIGVGSPPTASFTASAQQILAGESVSFDGSASTDPNSGGSISSWAWEFGDGTSASGRQTAHTYTTPGQYTASLVVTDVFGLQATAATRSISVTARPGSPGQTTTSESATVVAPGRIVKVVVRGQTLLITVSEPAGSPSGRAPRSSPAPARWSSGSP